MKKLFVLIMAIVISIPFSGCFDRFQIRSLTENGDIPAEPVGFIKNILQGTVVIFKPEKHIYKNRPVAVASQGTADGRCRDEGDMPFRADSSAQNNNFHN